MTNKCENCNESNMCEDVAGSCEKTIGYANEIYNKALDDLLNSLPDCDYVGIEHLVCLAEQLKRGGEDERLVTTNS